ncbi:hypothetical protein [Herbiconiux sp. A18JL235]|uniref:DivIVA domain-containing protein n=1 Tax=Herbiconiux sp. A18JL235 TaxID=3152363 RepID=A0AB39BNA6_9MICO
MSKMSWRNPNSRDALYLNQIAAWGYTLSEVEQIIVDAEEREPGAYEGDRPDDELDEE